MRGQSSGLQIKYLMCTPPSCFLHQIYPVFLPLLGKICDKIVLDCFPAGSFISGFSAADRLDGIVGYTNASTSVMACREGRKIISWKYREETAANRMYSFPV